MVVSDRLISGGYREEPLVIPRSSDQLQADGKAL
jgi:hypothetical protein